MKRFSSSAETPPAVAWPPTQSVSSVRQTECPRSDSSSDAATPPIPAPATSTSQSISSTRSGTETRTTALAASPDNGTLCTSRTLCSLADQFEDKVRNKKRQARVYRSIFHLGGATPVRPA